MADVASKYAGNGFSLRGDKGRFVLPVDFRSDVIAASNNTQVLCLDKHHALPCLVGFGMSRRNAFEDELLYEERIALERGEKFDRERRRNQLYGFETVKFDESGRFFLPDFLADAANIGDALFFRGAGIHFTIWAPDQLAAMDDGWSSAQRKCAQLAAEYAAKARRK